MTFWDCGARLRRPLCCWKVNVKFVGELQTNHVNPSDDTLPSVRWRCLELSFYFVHRTIHVWFTLMQLYISTREVAISPKVHRAVKPNAESKAVNSIAADLEAEIWMSCCVWDHLHFHRWLLLSFFFSYYLCRFILLLNHSRCSQKSFYSAALFLVSPVGPCSLRLE